MRKLFDVCKCRHLCDTCISHVNASQKWSMFFCRTAKVLVLQERYEMFNRLGRHHRITQSIGVHVLTGNPTPRPSFHE